MYRGFSRKVAHVRDALGGPSAGHHCHWPGCSELVPPAAWGCRPHWYSLPEHLRTRIWAAYRPGQEVAKNPSRQYLAVAKEVQAWIAQHSQPAHRAPPAPEQASLVF